MSCTDSILFCDETLDLLLCRQKGRREGPVGVRRERETELPCHQFYASSDLGTHVTARREREKGQLQQHADPCRHE